MNVVFYCNLQTYPINQYIQDIETYFLNYFLRNCQLKFCAFFIGLRSHMLNLKIYVVFKSLYYESAILCDPFMYTILSFGYFQPLDR